MNDISRQRRAQTQGASLEGAGVDSETGLSVLFTDLYELTMLQAYHEEGMDKQAVFSLYVRRLPKRRNYMFACGLEQVLAYLEKLHVSDDDIAYLRSLGMFSDSFLAWLRDFRFSGDVYAVPEGTPLFANEPLLEVVAPMPQAQVIETLVMNQMHMQTVFASKAVRVVEAAQGRGVVDFGARRMHGIDAALRAARAFHIAGVAATSNVLAGKVYGVPVAGTMAHSYIQAHRDEATALRDFTRLFPTTILLVDTYDTLQGVQHVINLAAELGDQFKVRGVRLDSGDLRQLAIETRRRLDNAGLQGVEIFASGGLDEDEIARLLATGAPIDGFGVGTQMGVSHDAPDLDIVYKLCAYAGKGRLKLSTDKPILPGRKQIFRTEEDGTSTGDVIARAEEELPGRPLLNCVMRNGKRLPEAIQDLDTLRQRARSEIERLPAYIRAIEPAERSFPVAISEALSRYRDEITQWVKEREEEVSDGESP